MKIAGSNKYCVISLYWHLSGIYLYDHKDSASKIIKNYYEHNLEGKEVSRLERGNSNVHHNYMQSTVASIKAFITKIDDVKCCCVYKPTEKPNFECLGYII